MNFNDAFQSKPGYGLGQEATVSGFLVVSQSISYLCASESHQTDAILVLAPWLVDSLLSEIPVWVGSMMLFNCQATITGQLSQSGLGLTPLVLYSVSTVTISHDGRTIVVRA